MKNIININYPRGEYIVLNKKIKNLINKYIQEFLNYGEGIEQPYFDYTLDINYQKYSYKDYISYIFFISMYTGGAHPNNLIETVNYNIKDNSIIDIEYLIYKNKNILEILSQESYEILKNNANFKDDDNILQMLKEGTLPKIENFKNIVLSKDGLIIYFPQYQVAPYSYGSFKVVIPYSKLK